MSLFTILLLVSAPLVKTTPERLPDLAIPRSGHAVFYANGELTVAGGHTTGFVPTATAEYFRDGEWHTMQMVYAHDNGLAVPLKAGKVLLCGGHNEPIGIGQTFLSEWYDPASHTFTGFGCLAKKRTLAQGIEVDSGSVVIAGNHYHSDGIELFDGKKFFSYVKDVAVERCSPFLFRTSDGDVTIVGTHDTRFEPCTRAMADRVKGGPFHVPLLEEWQTPAIDYPFDCEASCIGDYSYLLPVVNASQRHAIVLVRDTVFTLLPTDSEIPTAPLGDTIQFNSSVVADRSAQRAYLMGYDRHDDYYFLCIDYGETPAKLTLNYVDHSPEIGHSVPVLTPDGNLIVIGGINYSHDNFAPLASVWLIPVNGKPVVAESSSSSWPWLHIIIILGAVAAVAAALFLRKARKPHEVYPPQEESSEVQPSPEESPDILFTRLCRFMDEQQPYLQSRLRQSDVAAALDVSTPAISDCLATCRGITFPQFLAEYRVRHAQQLLSTRPDEKLASVYAEAGFTSESTFFRTFKTVTGLSPKEWLAAQSGS